MKTRTNIVSIFLIMIVLNVFLAITIYGQDAPFELRLLDVGQGQSVLIRTEGHAMLVDGGGAKASSFVVSYLKSQGIYTLDYVVPTHYDDDHLNGIVGALHVFNCQTILAPDYESSTDIYQSFLSAAENSGAGIVHPTPGEVYLLGDAKIDVVGPATYNHANENDSSIALKITYGDTSYLICGDAQDEAEEDMVNSGMDLQSDVYVVNHHGSATSSGFYFLDQVMPSYALLSCGADNSYGHPDKAVMERLQSLGCELYRTDKQGTVIAYSDGASIWFNQEASNDWSEGGTSAKAAAVERGSNTDNSTGDDAGGTTYVCNINTMKFHYEYCDSVNKMKDKNKKYTTESRDSLIAQGYVPCKNCNP